MKVFDKRIFRCENGHEYESDEPIQSAIQQAMRYAVGNKNIKCNSFCKFCDAMITSEVDYKDGKIVAGAILT